MATTRSAKTAAKTVARPAKAEKKPKPSAKFRFRITSGDVNVIGPGKISLLEAIRETGSITSAAKSLDMSYRRAWMLLDELNRSLRKPAVDSAKGGQHGGGSELTDVGRQLIDSYRRIEDTASRACAADIKHLMGLIAA